VDEEAIVKEGTNKKLRDREIQSMLPGRSLGAVITKKRDLKKEEEENLKRWRKQMEQWKMKKSEENTWLLFQMKEDPQLTQENARRSIRKEELWFGKKKKKMNEMNHKLSTEVVYTFD